MPEGCSSLQTMRVDAWGTDCVSVSAAFFSPSHVCSCSLRHQVASIASMINDSKADRAGILARHQQPCIL
jgi:hypothetical protein